MRRKNLGTLLIILGGAGLALVAVTWSAAGTGGTSMEWFWLIVLPALLLVGGLNLRREEPPRSTSNGEAVDHDVEEDEWTPVTVTGVPEGPVSACMRCGSLKIQPAPMGADALFSQYRCARCHFRGQPLQFDTGDAYAAFVRGLHEGGRN